MKILILVDYRGQFWLKTTHKEANFDLTLLARSFSERGCAVEVKTFSEVRLEPRACQDVFVVYQSTQDPHLLYKGYIEDVLLGLKLAGATLVPDFPYFRAHHNKVFMEILRDLSPLEELKNVRARGFGTYEEYLSVLDSGHEDPVVFKLSDGDRSHHVRLLRTAREKARVPRRFSRTFHAYYSVVNMVKPFLRRTYPGYRPKSNHRRKFIVQNFIPGLDGDFKILVFGKKYYVLRRMNRVSDFRASGSGRFLFDRELPAGLLDFARKAFDGFDVPFVSLDVASTGGACYLLEFQFVSFGTYTLEKAPFYFVPENGGWELIEARSVLEEEFASAVVEYIQHRSGPQKKLI